MGWSWGFGGVGGELTHEKMCFDVCVLILSLSFFDTPIPKSSDVQVEYIEIGSAHQFACLYCRNTVCLHDVF